MKRIRTAWMALDELKDKYPDVYESALTTGIWDSVGEGENRKLFMITLEAEAEKDIKKRSDKMIAVNEKKGRRDEKVGKGKVRG